MTGTVSIMLALIIIGLPSVMISIIASRFMRLREKKLEVEAIKAGERTAQHGPSNASLEQRVRILEQIITDAGAQTADRGFAVPCTDSFRRPRIRGWRSSLISMRSITTSFQSKQKGDV